MYRALWSWLICVIVTVVVSLMTKPKPDSELEGLVYGATAIPNEGDLSLLQKPIFWAGVAAGIASSFCNGSSGNHMEKHHIIPVWFFVGVMLLAYGILILAAASPNGRIRRTPFSRNCTRRYGGEPCS